jgi:hypothetical protein
MSSLKNIKTSLPTYELLLPVSGKKIKYRPFTVREEKAILIGMQEKDEEQQYVTLMSVINECVFESVNVEELPAADTELLFISIRNKSLGEGMDIVATCEKCSSKSNVAIDLSKVLVKKSDIKGEIEIAPGKWVVLSYPSIKDSVQASKVKSDDSIIRVIASCMKKVIANEDVIDCEQESIEDRIDFIEDLTHEQFEKIALFFKNEPKVTYEGEYACPSCSTKNKIIIEGLENFFV